MSSFKDFETDIASFRMHSLRAGVGSAAANAGVADRHVYLDYAVTTGTHHAQEIDEKTALQTSHIEESNIIKFTLICHNNNNNNNNHE